MYQEVLPKNPIVVSRVCVRGRVSFLQLITFGNLVSKHFVFFEDNLHWKGVSFFICARVKSRWGMVIPPSIANPCVYINPYRLGLTSLSSSGNNGSLDPSTSTWRIIPVSKWLVTPIYKP